MVRVRVRVRVRVAVRVVREHLQCLDAIYSVDW
jgi:hypothetical protein